MEPSFRASGQAPFFAPVDPDTVRRGRSWFIGIGIAFVALGILAILLPFAAALLTTIAIGWLLVASGIFEGYHAIQNQGWAGARWALVSAAVELITGFLLIAFPVTGKLALTLILAAYFVAEGVLKIIRANQHRKMGSWGWLMFDGLLSILLGIFVLMRWPGTAVWVLGLFVGINLIVGGTSLLMIGAAARPSSGALR